MTSATMTAVDTPADEVARLARTFESSLYVRVERGNHRLSLRSSVRERTIGAVDLETAALEARLPDLPRHMVDALLEAHPELRPTRDGVGVRVTDVATRRAAELLIRWRIDLERFAAQMHNASP